MHTNVRMSERVDGFDGLGCRTVLSNMNESFSQEKKHHVTGTYVPIP